MSHHRWHCASVAWYACKSRTARCTCQDLYDPKWDPVLLMALVHGILSSNIINIHVVKGRQPYTTECIQTTYVGACVSLTRISRTSALSGSIACVQFTVLRTINMRSCLSRHPCLIAKYCLDVEVNQKCSSSYTFIAEAGQKSEYRVSHWSGACWERKVSVRCRITEPSNGRNALQGIACQIPVAQIYGKTCFQIDIVWFWSVIQCNYKCLLYKLVSIHCSQLTTGNSPECPGTLPWGVL